MSRNRSKSTTALDAVARFLTEQDDIRLGIVFGSLAAERPKPSSDLDIAILAEQPLTAERRLRLIEDLARATGRPVDLIDLQTAGLPITRTAILGGRVVFRRDDAAYPALLSRMLLDSADFLPYRDRVLRQRREAWIR